MKITTITHEPFMKQLNKDYIFDRAAEINGLTYAWYSNPDDLRGQMLLRAIVRVRFDPDYIGVESLAPDAQLKHAFDIWYKSFYKLMPFEDFLKDL